MEKKAIIVPAVAILAIAAMTICVILKWGNGEVIYFSIVAIAAVAGVHISKVKNVS